MREKYTTGNTQQLFIRSKADMGHVRWSSGPPADDVGKWQQLGTCQMEGEEHSVKGEGQWQTLE